MKTMTQIPSNVLTLKPTASLSWLYIYNVHIYIFTFLTCCCLSVVSLSSVPFVSRDRVLISKVGSSVPLVILLCSSGVVLAVVGTSELAGKLLESNLKIIYNKNLKSFGLTKVKVHSHSISSLAWRVTM